MSSILSELSFKMTSSIGELNSLLHQVSDMDYLTLAKLQETFIFILEKNLKVWDAQLNPLMEDNPVLGEALGQLKSNLILAELLGKDLNYLKEVKLQEPIVLNDTLKTAKFSTPLEPIAVSLINLCMELSWRSMSPFFWESFVTVLHIRYPKEAKVFQPLLLTYLATTCHKAQKHAYIC